MNTRHITHVWIMDNKPSTQYFEKDANLTWVDNFAPTIRRIDEQLKQSKQ